MQLCKKLEVNTKTWRPKGRPTLNWPTDDAATCRSKVRITYTRAGQGRGRGKTEHVNVKEKYVSGYIKNNLVYRYSIIKCGFVEYKHCNSLIIFIVWVEEAFIIMTNLCCPA